MIVALDPGIRGVGFALGTKTELHVARYVANPCAKGDGPAAVFAIVDEVVKQIAARVLLPQITECAFEIPQVYQGSKQKGDPNDLVPLAALGHALAFHLRLYGAKPVGYKPREWKGSVDSNTTARRILERLSDSEQRYVEALPSFLERLARCEQARKQIKNTGHKAHNTVDAVGIYLKAAGRFEPRRVFANG